MKKLGNVEFSKEELMKYFFEEGEKFIIQYRRIYQVFYNENTGFSAKEIYYKKEGIPLTLKGRFFMGNANFVNKLVGKQLVVD